MRTLPCVCDSAITFACVRARGCSDYLVGWVNTSHNDTATWWLLYLIPSGFWLVIPALGIRSLASQILKAMEGKSKAV